MNDFVNLHVHTDFSSQDGAQTVTELCDRVLALKQPGVALTDHGTLAGSIRFKEACQERGLRAILGCELYLDPDTGFEKTKIPRAHHITVLAKNRQGYTDLCELVSRGNLENFKWNGRVKLEWLVKMSGNLIILTGCLASELRYLKDSELSRYAKFMRWAFPHLYAEIQNNDIFEQEDLNERAIGMAEEVGIKTVCTGDCHYSCPEHRDRWRILNAFEYQDCGSDFSLIHGREDPVTMEILDLVEDYEITRKPTLPKSPSKLTLKDLALPLCPNYPEYLERCHYELGIIHDMGFDDYFLILHDLVDFCKREDIAVGPGRGSAAGSLVCFLLGITCIDPLKHGLIFERFLNPERISLPDVDMDFQASRRGEVIQYLEKAYGNAYGIANHSTLKAKSAFKDAARHHGLDFDIANQITKSMPPARFGFAVSLEDSRELSAEFDEYCRTYPHVYDTALSLEGIIRGRGRHAGGVVLCESSIYEYAPVCIDKEKRPMLEYDMNDVEKAGLVKFDLLGLRALDVIQKCKSAVGLKEIPTEDIKAYQTINNGDTFGVFQLESGGITDLCTRVRPQNLSELSDVIALYRPGPMESGMLDWYVDRTAPDPFFYELLPIVAPTRGVIIYQEQVMEICRVIAGYSMAEADKVRKIMGKKKRDAVTAAGEEFVQHAVQLGRDPQQVKELWEALAKFAAYGFNKSHSTAYALLAYQTAYLKAHHPAEFYAEVYNSYEGKIERQAVTLGKAMSAGIEVIRPQLGVTKNEHSLAAQGKIQLGWTALKGVGASAAKVANTTYKSLQRCITEKVFCRRVGKALVKAGAVASSKASRSDMLAWLQCKTKKAQKAWAPGLLFDPLFLHDVEIFGLQIVIEPLKVTLENIRARSGGGRVCGGGTLVPALLTRIEKKRTRAGAEFAILWLQDEDGLYDMPMWPEAYASGSEGLTVGNIHVIERSKDNSILRAEPLQEIDRL